VPGPRLDATYARVAELPLLIDRCELVPLVRDTSSGFTKVSIVVRLSGGGHEGEGEDITWDQIDQIEQLRRAGDLAWLRGRRTLDEFSTLLGLADLFPASRSERAHATTDGGRSKAPRSTSRSARTASRSRAHSAGTRSP
jgi:hypothetical protein